MTRKEKIQELLATQAKMPMPKEYIAILGKCTKIIYRWIPHINKLYFYIKNDGDGEIKGNVTARSLELLTELRTYVENVCEIRMYLISLSSMIMLLGFHWPSKQSLDKFTKTLEVLEDTMINNFVIIERYKKAINNHRKLNIKDCKTPMTMDELQDQDYWPGRDITRGFIEHGIRVMDLNFQK